MSLSSPQLQFMACFLGAVAVFGAASDPKEIPTGFQWVDPVLPTVRESYEAPGGYYHSPDGWVQSYPSPTCGSSKTCVQNGCETHALRWAWEDPRKEPIWPANLKGCECEPGKPAYARCLYDVD